MINLVLTFLPLFFLSFLYKKNPKGIFRKLVNIQRRFLWGCEDGREKISRVEWEKICCHKENGGLGVNGLSLFNIT